MFVAIFKFMEDVHTMLKSGLFWQLTIAFAFIYLWRVAYRVQESATHYNWMSVIVGPDGSISQTKTQQVIAFIVVTWIVIYYAIKGQLSEAMFGLYFGFTTVAVAANRYMNKDMQFPPTPPTVTVTAPPGGSVSATASSPASGEGTTEVQGDGSAAPEATVEVKPPVRGE